MLVTGVAAVALPAYAESDKAARQDVAVQVFGSFLTTTTQNGIDNTGRAPVRHLEGMECVSGERRSTSARTCREPPALLVGG